MSDAKGRGLPYTTSGTRVTSIRGVPVSGFLAMEIPEGEDRSLGEEALETMERASSWAERLRERNARPYG